MKEDAPGNPLQRSVTESDLEHRFGDFAADYAATREETARALDDHDRADAWARVEEDLKARDDE